MSIGKIKPITLTVAVSRCMVSTNGTGMDHISIQSDIPSDVAFENFVWFDIKVKHNQGQKFVEENLPDLIGTGLVEILDCQTGERTAI